MLANIANQRGKKTMANRAKNVLHTMFKWAKQPGRKFVTVNPFADLPAPGGAIVKRDRFLSGAEIRQVWSALDEPERFEVSQDAATALRLVLVTAARVPSQQDAAELNHHLAARPLCSTTCTWPPPACGWQRLSYQPPCSSLRWNHRRLPCARRGMRSARYRP